jgi:hypothetical protein
LERFLRVVMIGSCKGVKRGDGDEEEMERSVDRR